MSEHKNSTTPNVMGNASYAMLGKVVYLCSRLIIPPLVLSYIGLAEYGLWSTAFILVMYIGLADVGFSAVYVRYVAHYHAASDSESINRLLSTGIVTLSVISVLILSVLWLVLPYIFQFLKVDVTYHAVATILIFGTSTMFLLDMSLGAYCYLLHGLQKFREEQKVAMTGYLLELVLIISFLHLGLGVYALLLAFVIRYLWSLTSFMRLAHRFLPTLKISLKYWDKAQMQHFLRFGAGVQFSAALGTMLFSLDRVLAGYLLGPKGVALFELASKLPVSAISVPSAISNVTIPAAAGHAVRQNTVAISTMYAGASRAICLIASFPLAFMAFFASDITFAWLNHRNDLLWLPEIMTMTAIWSHFHIVTGPGSSVFRGIGNVANEFVYHGLRLGCLAVFIPLQIVLYGANAWALASGIALGSVVAALAYMCVNHRKLGIKIRALINEVILPGLPAYAVAGLVWLVWQWSGAAAVDRLTLIFNLGIAGVFYSVLLMMLLWFMVLRIDERQRLAQMLMPLFERLYSRKVKQ